jgi:hypothetical protein
MIVSAMIGLIPDTDAAPEEFYEYEDGKGGEGRKWEKWGGGGKLGRWRKQVSRRGEEWDGEGKGETNSKTSDVKSDEDI